MNEFSLWSNTKRTLTLVCQQHFFFSPLFLWSRPRPPSFQTSFIFQKLQDDDDVDRGVLDKDAVGVEVVVEEGGGHHDPMHHHHRRHILKLGPNVCVKNFHANLKTGHQCDITFFTLQNTTMRSKDSDFDSASLKNSVMVLITDFIAGLCSM